MIRNIDSADVLDRSPLCGSLWESFVFTEMIKNGYATGKDLFFYRDQNGVEIDFIIEKSGKTSLIEAKYAEVTSYVLFLHQSQYLLIRFLIIADAALRLPGLFVNHLSKRVDRHLPEDPCYFTYW